MWRVVGDECVCKRRPWLHWDMFDQHKLISLFRVRFRQQLDLLIQGNVVNEISQFEEVDCSNSHETAVMLSYHCEGDFSLFVQGKSNMAARSYRILWSIINGVEGIFWVGIELSLNGNRNEQYPDSIKTTSICALNWDITTPHRNSTCWIPYIYPIYLTATS